MYFAVESAVNATGFRIFKDMLNRTFYKRISQNNTTTLAADLAVDATTITVVDGSVLSTPEMYQMMDPHQNKNTRCRYD
jgi:hypothetical protein